MLQGLDLTPSARLPRLDDTRLEPTHVMMYFLPIDGMPVHQLVRGRTSRDECCHLLGLLGRLIKLSR